VTPAVVSGVAQTLSLFPNAKSHSSPQEDKGTGSPGADVSKDGAPAPVDTVSISSQSRQALTEVKKEEAVIDWAKKEKVKKEDAAAVNGKSDTAAAKVLFVYDLNGELSIRYMDTADRLIYQSPSELMKQMKEAASKSDSSVDTKA
jgi:hypothetical protein